ncbi:hypothetical protein B0T22DRAFT_305637 [Podospora appendiculata]|uniref:Uncharacterized protein n=1 Tax=Podospora appendiculata TaxID=314037 RepID=A0AAE1C7G5_9PEZI|nr:hypothetical protein B0T22DRAFT_305637 [Podospora appendiculata]
MCRDSALTPASRRNYFTASIHIHKYPSFCPLSLSPKHTVANQLSCFWSTISASVGAMSASESTSPSRDPLLNQELPDSYLGYLARLKDSKPCLNWLHRFLEHRPAEPQGQMDVLDVIGGRIQVRPSESVTLGNRAADVDFRIVQLSYCDEWSLDRTLLDSVCFAFDLDPFAVWVCFDDDYSHLENPWDSKDPRIRREPLPRQLPLAGDFLCLPFDQYETQRLFAVFARSRDQGPLDTRRCSLYLGTINGLLIYVCVVVLFIKYDELGDYKTQRDFATTDQRTSVRRPTQSCDKVTKKTQFHHYADEMLAWDCKGYVSTPENNPVCFALPHVRLLLNNFTQYLEKCRHEAWDVLDPNLRDGWDRDVEQEEKLYFRVYIHAERLSQCAKSLDHFLSLHQRTPSAVLKNATDDFAILLKEAIDLRNALRDRLGQRAAVLSLEESRKSIQMADSLKTLTQLAFVFTPLNFATSIFGANIVEFGNGTAPAWAFVVTAVAIGLATMLT